MSIKQYDQQITRLKKELDMLKKVSKAAISNKEYEIYYLIKSQIPF